MTFMPWVRSCAGLVVLALFSVVPVFAATLTVTSLADGGVASCAPLSLTCTLRQAIAAAAHGDTINITATGTIILGGTELVIDKNLTITGPGASSLTISGNLLSRVFLINSGITANISGLTIQNGRDGYGGGGIFNYGTLTLTNSTLSSNSAYDYGGGIYNEYGTLTLTNSTVSDNTSTYGGGIFNKGGMLTLTNSTVSGNSASYYGGGIYNGGGTVTLTNSTVSGNTANYQGGGIYNGGGTVTLTNSTVSGNSAPYNGGGIYNFLGTLTLTNSTLSGNTAPYGGGGGFYNYFDSTLRLKNTIVANSTSGGNCLNYGTITSYDHNLSDDGSCSAPLPGPGDLNSTPAGLDPSGLQNNGGPTQTIALLATSPAVNAIPTSPTNFCTAVDGTTPIATDQRGFLRPSGPACDIGAFEFGANPPPTDAAGPVTSHVVAAPNPASVSQSIILAAHIDDTDTGGSAIASADFEIRDGATVVLSGTGNNSVCTQSHLPCALDTQFNGVAEDVQATIQPGLLVPGVYDACVRGTDAGGKVGGFTCSLLVVYNPDGGFVTGGGWINSPAGAYAADLTLTGKATFGFVSKYQRGATTLTGQTEFQFKAGNLNFHSSSYDWLVVAGTRAQYKGTGTINGAGNYGFMLTAIDGQVNGGGGVDKFRIKITGPGGVVYDNQPGAGNNADPTTALGGGSIVIRQ